MGNIMSKKTYDIGQYFPFWGSLNEAEKNNIKGYNQGQGLFICGSRRMQIYVICTNEELDSFGTGGGL